MRVARFFALGLAAQTIQVLLARDLLMLAHGGEWATALLFALWMGGAAAGSAWAGGQPEHQPERDRLAWRITVTLAVLAPLLLCAVRAIRLLVTVPSGEALATGVVGLAASGAAGPVAFLSGALFPLLVPLPAVTPLPPGPKSGTQPPGSHAAAGPNSAPAVPDCARAATGYTWEAAGAAAAGFLLATGMLIRWNPFTLCAWALLLLLVCAYATVLPGVPAATASVPAASTAGPCRCRSTLYVLALYLALLGGTGPHLDWLSLTWACRGYAGADAQLLARRHSPRGRVTAVACRGQVSLYENGAFLFSLSRGGEMAPYVHTALLQHPRPERVLLVNGCYSGILPELLRQPVRSVACVEPDPAIGELAEQFAPAEKRQAWGDPRVTVTCSDSRRFVRKATARYDVIFVVPGEPVTVAANRLFTRECFRELRERLTADGVLAFGPVSAGAGCTEPVLLARNRSLWATLHREFAQVRVTAGDAPLFLATNGKLDLTLEPATLAARGQEWRLPENDASWLLDPFSVAKTENELQTGARLEPPAPVPAPARAAVVRPSLINTDHRPAGGLLTGRMRGTVEPDRAAGRLNNMADLLPLVWLLPFLVAVLVAWLPSPHPWNERLRCEVATVSLGFWGAAVQWLILISLQSSFGALYRWVGALTGTFMLGLAAGAWRISRARHPARWLKPILGLALIWSWLAGMVPIVLAVLLHGGGETARGFCYILLSAGAGGCVGGGFPAALSAWIQADRVAANDLPSATPAAALLYTLDLLGGMLGLLLTACVILPGHGIIVAASIAAGTVALALLGLATPR